MSRELCRCAPAHIVERAANVISRSGNRPERSQTKLPVYPIRIAILEIEISAKPFVISTKAHDASITGEEVEKSAFVARCPSAPNPCHLDRSETKWRDLLFSLRAKKCVSASYQPQDVYFQRLPISTMIGHI
jgi:hypothetical protein